MQWLIGGVYGGYACTPAWVDPIYMNDAFYRSAPVVFQPAPVTQPMVAGVDPVNMLDGSFTLNNADLDVGQSEPRGFAFTRHYDTNRRYTNYVNMANGWTHNYNIQISERSDAAAALGKASPQEMVTMLVATRAAWDVFTGTPDSVYTSALRWSVTALIAE